MKRAALVLAAALGCSAGAPAVPAPIPQPDPPVDARRRQTVDDAAAAPDAAPSPAADAATAAVDSGGDGMPADAGGDLPRPDAAPPDGAGDLRADAAPAGVACGSRPLAVCDGFETPAIDTRVWKLANAGNLKIDGARAFRGARSLFVRGENRRDGGGRIYLDGTAVAPFRDGFFGRAYVYLGGRTPRIHSDLVFAWGPASVGTVVWRYGIEAHVFAGNWWGGAGEGAFPSDRFFTRRDAVPVDRWFCMEWQFDRRANEMRFWLDGAERRSLWRTGGSGWPAPVFQRIELGFQIFGQDSGGDFLLWFDEVALDTARIGC